MATVSLMLKKNKMNSKGELPLYIELSKDEKQNLFLLELKYIQVYGIKRS